MLTRKNIFRSLAIGFSAALFCFMLAPQARAGIWNEQTWVTFSAPVEVPGHVLPAGTYDFQLMNSPMNRNVVEIFNKQRTRLYAIVVGEPTYRVQPTGNTVISFSERPVDTPEAIHKWFYPGMLYGVEFVYAPRPHVNLASIKVKRHLAKG